MNEDQIEAVNDILKAFQEIGLNQYIIVIGSWAEFFYTLYLKGDFHPEIATRDIDFLYPDIHAPKHKIDLISRLKNLGFLYNEDLLSGSAKFIKGNLLELEFITRVIGPDQNISKIKSINITAESVREIKILSDHVVPIVWRDVCVNVPEPAAYILHKLLINPIRKRSGKQEKDMRSIRNLMSHIHSHPYQVFLLGEIYRDLSIKQKRIIDLVCTSHNIDKGFFV